MRFWTTLGIGLALVGASALPRSSPGQAPATASAAAPARAAEGGPAEAAIKERLAGFAKAYNGRNAAGVSDLFAEDATLVDVDGAVVRGKGPIGAQFAAGFAQSSNYTLESTIESIRFITPDVAQVEGVSKLVAPNEAAIVNRFVILIAKKDNVWRIAEIRDLPAPPEDVPPADRLKELEWMVGDWVDQNDDMKISSSIKWGENKAYLTRSTSVQIGDQKGHSSLMIVAWDPQGGQIRSWLFDSDGGRGEAVWTRASDHQWIIRAEGVLRNGSPTSATQIVTLVGKDAVKTTSTDRIIGGEVAPDIDEVMMVRKPPATGVPAPAPAPAAGARPSGR